MNEMSPRGIFILPEPLVLAGLRFHWWCHYRRRCYSVLGLLHDETPLDRDLSGVSLRESLQSRHLIIRDRRVFILAETLVVGGFILAETLVLELDDKHRHKH